MSNTKQIANSLTLALMKAELADFKTADAFATAFVEENAELLTVTVTPILPQGYMSPGQQRAAAAPKCPNCHQPTYDHLPGCSRIPNVGTDARATTDGDLSAVSE